MASSPNIQDHSEDESLFLVMRDEKCRKIQLIISSEGKMTGQEFIGYLVDFIETYEENIQEILDTAPKISSH